MKKLFALLLVLLMMASLVVCGEKEAPGPTPGTALSTFYQAVLDLQPEDAEELILFEEVI